MNNSQIENPGNNYVNISDAADILSGNPKYNRNYAAKTIDPEEDKASNYENVSAGGTRYIVGLKGNLKFYGAASNSQADINESLSAYSRSRGGGPLADLADSVSRGRKDEDYDNHSMEDRSIDRSEHDPRRGEYDKKSLSSFAQNEMNNGGFPINGPGEEGNRSRHGKKKKKKRKDLRPNTQQNIAGGFGNADYAHKDVIGDYTENQSLSHYSANSARGHKREPVPAPNLGERNKSVGSTGGERRQNMPLGQIALS